MGRAANNILVLNAGSSSIKFAVFDTDLNEKISGIAEGIGGSSTLKIDGEELQSPFIDHQSALKAVLKALDQKDMRPHHSSPQVTELCMVGANSQLQCA